MNNEIENYSKIAKALKSEYNKLNDFEALSLAIQIERNQLLENGFNVSRSDSHPSALEAIAVTLGYSDKRGQRTITEVLTEIADKRE